MIRRIIIHETAEAEIDEIARYLARDNLTVALRFYDAVEESCDLLARMPGIGKGRIAKDRALKDLRSWSVKGFGNYLLFYVSSERAIEVLHVVHGARDLPRSLGVE